MSDSDKEFEKLEQMLRDRQERIKQKAEQKWHGSPKPVDRLTDEEFERAALGLTSIDNKNTTLKRHNDHNTINGTREVDSSGVEHTYHYNNDGLLIHQATSEGFDVRYMYDETGKLTHTSVTAGVWEPVNFTWEPPKD